MPLHDTDNNILHDKKPASGLRLSIFSRLVIGYVIIFMLIAGVGIYVNTQFNKLGDITSSIITVNNRILSHSKRITDILLTLVNYEKKFVILKDESMLEQFMKTKKEFEQSFQALRTIAENDQVHGILNEIHAAYNQYETLCEKEFELLKSGNRYRHNWYDQEKDKAVNAIIAGLKELKTYNENSTYTKLIRLGEADDSARRVGLVITLLTALCGLILSVFITRSITRPIAVMRQKIRETARSNYQGNLQLSSPPEIGELMQDFNVMCDKLRETDRMKSDFFAFMSHELRTPITSIKEGTTLLIEGVGGEINEKQKRILQIISEESNRLIGLINSILDLSKMEAGMMQYHFVQTDIFSLLQKAITEMEPLARAKNIRTEFSSQERIPLIRADKEKLLQVLRNLIGNAVKFTPKGGHVSIYATCHDSKLEVSVSDEGPGIPAEHLHSIFDKFRSFDTIKGSGLGLALVRNVIKSHGGTVWAKNNQGQGSTFTFVLPA